MNLPRLMNLIAVSTFALAAALPWRAAWAQVSPPAILIAQADKAAPAKTDEPSDAKDAKVGNDAKDGKVAKDGNDEKDAKQPAPNTPEPSPTPAASPEPAPQPAPVPNFKVQAPAESKSATIGSLSDAKLEVVISKWGAAIESVRTAEYRETVDGKEPYTVLGALYRQGETAAWERPFGAIAVTINGDRVTLWDHVWELVGEGQYRITIVDLNNEPALRITRTYSLGQGNTGYDVTCRTSFANVGSKPLTVTWEQNALGDVQADRGPQGGDSRVVTAGYYNLNYDANRVHIYTDDAKVTRANLLEEFATTGQTIWPREDVETPNELAWLAMSNRYFTAVLHRPIPAAPEGAERVAAAPIDATFEAKIGMRVDGAVTGKTDGRVLMFTLTSKPLTIAPGQSKALSLSLYAGPRLKDVLNEPPYATLELGTHLVRYEQGCTWCLFDWLADFLLWFLTLIHAVVFDWGFAIIILVLVVRLLLHPITKKAQINMTKMSKQMATIQPELAKLKEKYKSDPRRQQQEMMNLYREKGVNPMGFLGCLPMFLQMPIWVALYAMLSGAIELRHEPAFWGVFQLFGDWQFLRDLSAPDNFIKFGEGFFELPVCGMQISHSLNILPILMAAVFYLQQKLTTPPPTNEQMAQQQKMMKWMVLLFPVMFYSMPSGLTLYIMASSLAGIVDSYYVRKHIKAEEAAGTLFTKKPPKPGGFFDRIQKMVEAKQKELEAKQAESRGKRPGDKRKR